MLKNIELERLLFEAVQNNNVSLSDFSFLEPIQIGHLTLLAKQNKSLINPMNLHGKAASFLSRVNFYDYIGIDDPFGNNIYQGNNSNTIEIGEANNSNQKVYEQVKEILKNEPSSTIETIDRLVSELVTNVEMYAVEGVVIGQVINRTFHLAIVDQGPGIANHLRDSDPKYMSWKDEDVIREALKKGVTSGRGKGFGLWQTQEVLSRNSGSFIVRSGNLVVDGIRDSSYTAYTPWLGSSIDLRYNLDRPISFEEILKLQDIQGFKNAFGI